MFDVKNFIDSQFAAEDNSLEHHGVVGQKWGVINKRASSSGPGPKSIQALGAKQVAKADKKFVKTFGHNPNLRNKEYLAAYNRAAHKQNTGGIAKFNSNPKYKGLDFSKDSSKRSEYYNDYGKLFSQVMQSELTNAGVSPSGMKQATVSWNMETQSFPVITITDVDVKHDASSNAIYKIKIDAKGFFQEIMTDENLMHSDDSDDFEVPEEFIEDLAHSDMDDEDILNFLAHYGVVGMHWGRHDAARSSRPAGQKSLLRRNFSNEAGMKIVNAVRGHRARKAAKINSEAHTDHKNVSKLRKKKLHQLSNDELKALTQRMNLEKQYKDIMAKDKAKGQAFVEKAVNQAGNQFVSTLVSTGVNLAVKSVLDNTINKKKPAPFTLF